ncbi:4-hydroxy-3-methylbut-2-enyl diphosphate reductase, partial [Bacillus cereus]|nr:4-hydroxy-3-methylbut-2-enyl diphosphate reductase [Bacillus cereus]
GYHVIYIGKKNHPEPEGAVGIAPDIVHLIERADDLKTIKIPTDKILMTKQTTMRQCDVQHLMEDIQKKFPTAEFHKEICLATQVRQEAVAKQTDVADLTTVVAEPKSTISNHLAQVA